MNHFSNRIGKFLAGSACAGMFLVGLAGCAANSDLLTYYNDSMRDGITQYNDQRYPEAVGSFRNAARQDPTKAQAEYYLGLAYEQTQSYEEAINAFRTCLALSFPSTDARYDRAMHDDALDRLARDVARTDTAGTQIDSIEAEAAAKRSVEDYQLLGRIFRYRGDADSAISNYRQAVQLAPDDFEAQKEYGLYLSQLGQSQTAAMTLRDAYRLNDSDSQVNAALLRVGLTPGPELNEERITPRAPVAPPPAEPGTVLPAGDTIAPPATLPLPSHN